MQIRERERELERKLEKKGRDEKIQRDTNWGEERKKGKKKETKTE